jgi:hypothetical protein
MQRDDLPTEPAAAEKRAWSRPTVADEDIRSTEQSKTTSPTEQPETEGATS